MAVWQYFNSVSQALGEGKHNLSTASIFVMLSNTAPVATNSVKADITEISAGFGYTAGGSQAITSSATTTGSTYKVVCDDVVFTGSGGSIGPFRYAVVYDNTATNDELLGWWDYGSSITLNDTDPFTVDLSPTNGLITIGHP